MVNTRKTIDTKILEIISANVLDEAIRDFVKAYSTQIKLGEPFEMHFLKRKDEHSIAILSREFKRNGSLMTRTNKNGEKVSIRSLYCFPRIFGSKTNLYCAKSIGPINHTCRLVWKRDDIFELHVPVDIVPKQNKSIGLVCSLDPGVRTFQTIYGSDGVVYSAGKMTIDDKCILVKSLYKKKSSTSRQNKRNRLKKARKIEKKIRDKIDDLHHKLAKFLTKKYDSIVIPKFSTQQIATKVNSTTKRQMYRWGHYRFRSLLKHKGVIHGCKVFVGTEEYTSRTCGNCFNDKTDLGSNKSYSCDECVAYFDRDINAARNILMLNWDRFQFKFGLPTTL